MADYAIDRHFRTSEVLPETVLIRASHDMRNPHDLAALDGVTKSLANVDGVSSVRSFTQPTGGRVQQASVPYQAGLVGQGLGSASAQVKQGTAGVTQLSQGAQQLSGGASQLASGAHQAADATGALASGLAQEDSGLQRALSGAASAQGGA